MTKKRGVNEELKKKLSVLDPKFKKQISELFRTINESVSLLYDEAIHDEKTGLYNNKFFNTIIEMEIRKAKRGEKLSLFIIDIDFFKKINDKYGHIKADELLIRLADLLNRKLRKSDVIARFGGEEFIILLPDTPLKKAKTLTTRIKTAIKSDSVLKKYNFTISGGLTEFKKSDTKSSFLKRADKALYKAKNAGRNQFVLAK